MDKVGKTQLIEVAAKMFKMNTKDVSHFKKVVNIFLNEVWKDLSEFKTIKINNFIDIRLIPGRVYELVFDKFTKTGYRKNNIAISYNSKFKKVLKKAIDFNTVTINYKAKKTKWKKREKKPTDSK